jgi:oligopeptide/dipeptide ABC transporter ATP-binding protein
VVEVAGLQDLFEHPFHPYTKGLLKSIPRLGSRAAGRKKRLDEIKGTVPSLLESVDGCKFADRCPQVFDVCRERQPGLETIRDGHQARCWLSQPGVCSLRSDCNA